MAAFTEEEILLALVQREHLFRMARVNEIVISGANKESWDEARSHVLYRLNFADIEASFLLDRALDQSKGQRKEESWNSLGVFTK